MTPTTIATEIIFGHIRPEAVLDWKVVEGLLLSRKQDARIGKTPAAYLEAAHEENKLQRHSQEEKESTFILAVRAMHEFHTHELDGKGTNSMFCTLLQMVSKYLLLRDNAAAVRSEKLLAWRMLTTAIGQDLAVCGFVALQDHLMNRERLDFGWPLHLPCDNAPLRAMLGKGMAENHYHLWGSVPSFHLLWLRLMGNAHLHEQALAAPLKSRLHADSVSEEAATPWRLDELSRFAAILRLGLAQRMELVATESEERLGLVATLIRGMLHKDGPSQHRLSELADHVDLLAQTTQAGMIAGYASDYAMPAGIIAYNHAEGLPLAFERYFLYQIWRRILAGLVTNEELHWFYLYILIKAKVRREYVQVNDRVGFHNFKVYQDRKGDFGARLNGDAKNFFSFWAARLALTRPLKDMPISMLEARIAPPRIGDTPTEFENTVRWIVEASQTKLKKYLLDAKVKKIKPKARKQLSIADRLYFVVHFLKRGDDADLKFASCRHSNLREELKAQSQIMWAFEESGSHWAGYIRGIDAASGEIGCRPEVFAHAFRFLRLFQPAQDTILDPERQPQVRELRVTYHVGEDFLDLIDGLRAIDEAIFYLDYRRGDRLGHALALGVDARDWYEAKQKVVMLPRQDLVDNLAWMHAQLVAIGNPLHLPLIAKLEVDWSEHVAPLIQGLPIIDQQFTILQYHRAWSLRGDDPELYALGEFRRDDLQQPWQLASVLRHRKIKLTLFRKDAAVTKIHHYYHYSSSWKEAGREIVDYEIESGYVAGAATIQRHLQLIIRDKGISIEANPTSNYLIGTFQRYDKHPLPTLHNLGLTHEVQALASNPQMHISINTDDLGIFDTSLENEYALMATALSKMKNADGSALYSPAMIMDWLDRVREMGLQQSFRTPRNRKQ